MKTLTKILAIATVVTLAACGSTGSDDDKPKITFTDKRDKVPADYKWNPNEIIIDGKETVIIDISNINKPTNSYGLTKVNNYPAKINGKNEKIDTLILPNKKLENSHFGLTIRGDLVEGFSNGDKSQIIPKGTASYEVDAVVSNFIHQDYKIINGAKINVDFDNKSVKGNIANTQINAKIEGNMFKEQSEDFLSFGFFYGDNAKEIGGGFVDTKWNEVGAFGGTKK